uniref:carbonic anhydrase n=1 Tax=Albugo laibachii Nc14 TaxID=890382 RepID=F0WTD8_9STRA|nr:carbonic anhydrase putative [Albugo laibachii Nc14]|eukprot:CCA24628.1 carbonic anhydrase putative [Albugo laibachii Nc14]
MNNQNNNYYGEEQSPVDLSDAVASHEKCEDLSPIFFCSTNEMKAELQSDGTNFKVCLQNLNQENHVSVSQKMFHCAQFHFHAPSEHTVNGKRYDMEFHLVNQAEDGSLAVFGILFELGEESSFLAQFWDHLQSLDIGAIKEKKSIDSIDLSCLLKSDKGFYRLRGSLTTPPYSEGVEWTISRDIWHLSEKQLNQFCKCLKKNNARPIQPLNKRKLQYFHS